MRSFYKDWSGTSSNRTGPPKLVGSGHRHHQDWPARSRLQDLTGRTIRNPACEALDEDRLHGLCSWEALGTCLHTFSSPLTLRFVPQIRIQRCFPKGGLTIVIISVRGFLLEMDTLRSRSSFARLLYAKSPQSLESLDHDLSELRIHDLLELACHG